MRDTITPRLAALQVGNLRYNSPMVQVALMAFVVFCTSGMFTAINNLGAGGTQDVILVDISQSVLFATFAISGFFGGTMINLLGTRVSLFIGSLGPTVYVGALWVFQTEGVRPFLIVAGAMLGFMGTALFSAQGTIMMAYPMEKDKGRAFSLYWIIFQFAPVIGGFIVLGETAGGGTKPALGPGIYVAFIIIMLIGLVASCFALPAQHIVREDGTLAPTTVIVPKRPTFADEMRGIWVTMKDWKVWVLMPMWFASGFYSPYQGHLTTVSFDGRTRALVGSVTGIGGVMGGALVGILLDKLPYKRHQRGYIALVGIFIVLTGAWGGGLAYQLKFDSLKTSPVWDWTDHNSIGPIILFMSYYFVDAMFQGLSYWVIGGLSNDSAVLARYAGLYKGIQSGGHAVAFGVDAAKTPLIREYYVAAGLLIFSMPVAWFAVRTIRDTNKDIEIETVVDEATDLTMQLAVPKGHHLGPAGGLETPMDGDEKNFEERIENKSIV